MFDWPLLGDAARFVLGAPGRHPFLALALFSAAVGLAVVALTVLPRTFHSETTILASRNLVMPALGNPQRAIPREADAPARAAAETILRRDNVLGLMEQTDLFAHWQRTRAPLVRAKDFVLDFARQSDPEEKRDDLVHALETSLKVRTAEGTITIAIDWPDAAMAAQLVTLAQQNFLDTRHALEVSTIAEAISILEGHAAIARKRVDSAMEELRKERGSRPVPVAASRPRAAVPPKEPREDSELVTLRVMLVAKRRALREMEDFRQRRLAELQAHLAEQKAIYTLAHPVVVATRESIDSLAKDSPQLASLRREEQDLMKRYLARGGKEGDADRLTTGSPAAPVHVQIPPDLRGEATLESEMAQYWRAQLDFAVRKYEELAGRIEAAQIELDTARAAFKYRYSVVRPAEVPKKPVSPRTPLLALAGIMGGLLLAFGGAGYLDWRCGVLLQRWQIERQLGVPVLAETDSP